MMRSILAAAALGILAAVPAVYLLSASPRQDSAVTRPGADRAATEAAVPVEAWPICSSMASMAESADWAALDPDFTAGKQAIVAGSAMIGRPRKSGLSVHPDNQTNFIHPATEFSDADRPLD